MGKNQIVKHYLIRWGHFDKFIGSLTNTESTKMKILYSALKEMDPEERQFLANKYRTTKKPILPDAVLAKQYGLAMQEYRDKRISIESKMNPIISKYDALYNAELIQSIANDHPK